MRDSNPDLELYRREHPALGKSDGMFGYFVIGHGRNALRVISSGAGSEWEHVSVSKAYETPSWDHMCLVKDLFWREDETVIQFHPTKSKYKNLHPFVLHLWKHKNGHQLPPDILV